MGKKTPEQAEADDLLEKAVQKVIAAYHLTPEGSMVADYFVVGESIKFVDDDEECDIFIAWRNGHGRITTTLGIFEMGRRHMLSRISTTFDSDDES